MTASLRSRSLATWAVIAIAMLWVAGCPAPTGRRRGSLTADGGACALQTRPANGEACSTPSATCDFEVSCEDIGRPEQIQTERCSCNGGRWSCTTIEACFSILPDGAVECPNDDDPRGGMTTFACSPRFEGRVCPLRPFTCSNGSRPLLNCRCDGNFWLCDPVNCGEIPGDGGIGTGRAGSPCVGESDCAPLTCSREVPDGVCTTSCSNSSSQAEESSQCGGAGTTCLADSSGSGSCFAACRAGGPASVCRAGFACTGLWFTQMDGRPDSAACFPFCSSDAHCAAGAACNVRTGQCDGRSNPMGTPDGLPCRVGSNECQGQCFQIVEMGTTGVCGSIIDVARRAECPDGDGRVQRFGMTQDNLALCIFRTCNESECCPSGLVCEAGGGEGLCVPDDPAEPNIICSSSDGGASGDASSDANAADGSRDVMGDSGG